MLAGLGVRLILGWLIRVVFVLRLGGHDSSADKDGEGWETANNDGYRRVSFLIPNVV